MWRAATAATMLLAITLSGCIADEPPTLGPAATGDTGVIDTNTRLVLDGTGWARYVLQAEAGQRIGFTLDAPEAFDLCDPFFSDVYDLSVDDTVAVALFADDDLQGARWYMLHGMPWGWADATGSAACGKGTLTVATGTVHLVVATTLPGMAVDVTLSDTEGNVTRSAALAEHDAFTVHNPPTKSSGGVDGGMARAATQEHWVSETTGGARFVEALSWQMHRSAGVQMAHAELQNTRFGVTGIDEPREPAQLGLPYGPGFGTGGMTAGSSRVSGFASGDEPVKAWVERDTAIGVVNGERHAGLTVWALPLQPS